MKCLQAVCLIGVLDRNRAQLFTPFALGNLFLVRKKLTA